MSSQYSKDDSDLIEELMRLSKKSPKLVKSTVYQAPARPDISVRSWKMNEYKYNNIPCPFPTLARGLFTEDIEDQGDGIVHRIVARGYDKFFNIGEVPWTTWSSLESHTAPPYTLTLKSNGCIIFIAPLTPTKLLVTSKHSVGPGTDATKSHAGRGEMWLRKQFEKTGKTEEQMAKLLWENNWTAVAELCDDEFEEHVLPYPPEKTGLHLHGINESTRAFKTLPPDTVTSFAREWGFIETPYTTLKSIPEVKQFTDEVSKTGFWNGEPVEGFVVRTHVTEPPTKGEKQPPSLSPYPPGSTFFFKVKFDEPYMMYRDWREVTKTLLSKGSLSPGSVSKAKMKRPETRLYVNWVIGEIKRDRKQFDGYTSGHGIIRTRERFLEWLKGEEGKKGLKDEKEQKTDEYGLTGQQDREFGKTIIVPVAVPGCGKTAIAVAIVHLFGFGHTQSDDVKAKKAAPVFIKNVVDLLKTHDVVIADKNNHLRQHREQLREATKSFRPRVRLMALNWSFDQPLATIHRICGDRVLERGENHQTLRADTLGKTHEDVIWQFLHNAEELDDGEVDVSVEMKFDDTLEQAVNRVVDACVKILGVPRPSPEKIEEALQAAKGYAPRVKNNGKDKGKKAKTPGPPRYFGLLPEVDCEDLLSKIMEGGSFDVPESARTLYEAMRDENRISKRPHVTIVHSKSLPAESDLWERCMNIYRLPTGPLFEFKLGHVVWNDRIMAITVEDLRVASEGDAQQQEGHEYVSKLPPEVRDRLHITVGTRDPTVAPVEAKTLVEKWRKGEKVGVSGSIPLQDTFAKGRLKGLFS
ncbi:hypothetical protein GLOTRDRAFT_78807 [Gloeophyllum trabeum ATCC 11539]|uniref:tRNA ligase n=1 Tax=Gloeophyllum trabeum (strain ATCC 11539 / FP-39264 / Madison 617) TaxID=670483 RepID=S7RHG4_GLOTA|nr:uncharacterized protein GLOTRDRAFT_78807 [Gloeophyllum trabeum ATCC 11539]EPQ53735.1 hypothetical protein GLOTRDRAFT_78807 [Gloeophyllum trabeum ATCC 11539]